MGTRKVFGSCPRLFCFHCCYVIPFISHTLPRAVICELLVASGAESWCLAVHASARPAGASSSGPCIPRHLCCLVKGVASSVGKSEWFQAVFSRCLCCTVSTDILGIAVLRGSCEYIGGKPAGRAGGRDTHGFSSIKAAKDGSGFCRLCWGRTRRHSAADVASDTQSDTRQLRGEAERSRANSCCV